MSKPLRPGGLYDKTVALALAAGYVALLLATVGDLGYARDEGFYFQAANSYARWFTELGRDWHAAVDPRVVDKYWAANHEHPALMKALFALSSSILQGEHHLFAMDGTSYRFPAMVLSGLLIGLVYLWGTQLRGRAAGLSAALLLAAMPRFFYHAHLACFDAPIVALFTLTAYAYARSLRVAEPAGGGATGRFLARIRGLAWPALTGLCFGLALDTKHNAWFLPILFATHTALLLARGLLTSPRDLAVARRGALSLGFMAVVGPLVLYALWPWIWHDTLARLSAYVQFHTNHEYYNMELFGRNYWAPPMPRSYAWVMTAATVPVVTLVLFATGLAVRARACLSGPLRRVRLARRDGARGPVALARAFAAAVDPASPDLLWLGAVGISYAAWLSTGTPIFGGTKHWMTAYPFVALFAGAGFAAAVRALRRELALAGRRGAQVATRLARGPLPEVLLGAAALAAPIAGTAASHPWGLSSYTPLVGGASGAATLGLNRSFWGYTTGAVAGYLNEKVPQNGSVYLHDTAGQSWDMMLRDGRIRRDIRSVWSAAGADFALYHHEKHMLGQEYQAWVAFGTVRPAHIAGLDGVPVILVYERPRTKRR